MESTKSGWSKSASFFINFVGTVIVFIILKELQNIFIPLVIAYFLFFVFIPINNYLKKIKSPLPVIIILDLLIVIFFAGSISSVIIDSFSGFAALFPQYEDKLNGIISRAAVSLDISNPQLLNFKVGNVLTAIDVQLLAGNLFNSTFSFMTSLFLVIFFFVFVTTGHQRIYQSIRKRYIKNMMDKQIEITENPDEEVVRLEVKKTGEEILSNTFQEITNQVQKYLSTKFIMSLIMAGSVGLVLFIAGVDFPVVWMVTTFLFHFVPNIGSIIAVLLPCVMALIQYESFGFAVFLAVLLVVIQNIIGNFVEPKIFGNRLGLNPLVVLLSLLLWGYIWGIVGMILSVPLTSVIKIIISRSESPQLRFIDELMS